MRLQFSKYHGTGNDFIIIDGIKDSCADKLNQEKVSLLCHRRFGVGADGLIVIKADTQSEFYMHYYNSDGQISSMCGNGSRCAVSFAFLYGYIQKACFFRTADGLHEGRIIDDNISILMSEVSYIHHEGGDYILDTGSPHYVKFVESLDQLTFTENAQKIRYSETYREEGINVNFVKKNTNQIHVRTYERGVEDETFSCGTGVVASAIVSYCESESAHHEVHIKTKGGNLKVSFDKKDNNYKNIWLTGPAIKVYEGFFEL